MKRPIVIHPILFAVAPVVHLYYHNIAQVTPKQLLAPLVVVASLAVLVYALARFLLRDRIHGAVFTSLFLLLFFSYGHIANLVPAFNWKVAGLMIGTDKLLFSVWGLLLLHSGYLIIRTRRSLAELSSILNVVAAVLVIMPLVPSVAYEIRTKRTLPSTAAPVQRAEPSRVISHTDGPRRDIYYIILDSYGSATTLSRFYDFDNSQFINYLKRRNFYVASDSRTNYPKTFLSLASSLNMKHLTYLTELMGTEASGRTVVYEMLKGHQVGSFLRSRGYKLIHLSSGLYPTIHDPAADLNIRLRSATIAGRCNVLADDEFSMRLLETTLIYPVLHWKLSLSPRATHRDQVLYQFDRLAGIPGIAGPKFVFAHILLPHPPYVFRANGAPLSEAEAKARDDVDNYLEHVAFANQKVTRLLDQILANSQPDPIIILQADEGPYAGIETFGGFGGRLADWTQLSDEALRVHFGILNAYHLPGFNYDDLYGSITPVNSFRVIFNHYFGTNYELLADESYNIQDPYHPYAFVNVTQRACWQPCRESQP